MRPFFSRICLSVAVLPSTMPAAAHISSETAPVQSSLPDAARGAGAVVEAFHHSLKAGNLEGVSALLASNALIYESGGVERSKSEYAAHHLPADAEFAKGVTRTVTRQVGYAKGELAWVATESRTTGTYKGRAIDNASIETMVLRRDGKAWKIVHIHWSSAK